MFDLAGSGLGSRAAGRRWPPHAASATFSGAARSNSTGAELQFDGRLELQFDRRREILARGFVVDHDRRRGVQALLLDGLVFDLP